MPFWQQSGNSNSSHLRTVPSECAASTWSCQSPSLGINPYLFQHTHSGHYTVFLSVRTLRSASCEVCLEASCGWTKSIFRYASCSWNTERLYVFFPQRLVSSANTLNRVPPTAAARRFDRGVQNVKPCCASNNATWHWHQAADQKKSSGDTNCLQKVKKTPN